MPEIQRNFFGRNESLVLLAVILSEFVVLHQKRLVQLACVLQMNYTRQLWNDILMCHRESVDIIPLLLVSSFLALLPATFYIASHINGSDVRNNLLQRELSLLLTAFVDYRRTKEWHGDWTALITWSKLSECIKRILSIPATSTSSECSFSTAGRTLNKRQLQLETDRSLFSVSAPKLT